jgi:hypothetical protein
MQEEKLVRRNLKKRKKIFYKSLIFYYKINLRELAGSVFSGAFPLKLMYYGK